MHTANAEGELEPGAAFAFDLNLLASLAVLVRERNVTRAARALGISQPAMSHRLARLREHFGDPLLLQGSAGMRPTARALQLVEPVNRGLLEFDAALRSQASFDPSTSTRGFSVACVDFGEFVFLPGVLSRVHAQAPEISVRLLRPYAGLERGLERGLVDVAIVGQPPPAIAGLLQRRVLVGRFAVAIRADHPAVGERMDLDTYVGLPHLALSRSPGHDAAPADPVDDALARLGKARKITAQVPSFTAAPFLAARSDLALTAPLEIILEAAKYVPLRVFEPPLLLTANDVVMVWHERWQQEPGHRWLRTLLTEVMAAHASANPPAEPGRELSC